MGTHWQIGPNEKKKKSFPPSKLKRNKNKAPWAFPLAEKKTNPAPPSNKTCIESPVSKWTLDSPLSTPNTAWKKNLPSNLSPTPKFGDLVTSPIN